MEDWDRWGQSVITPFEDDDFRRAFWNADFRAIRKVWGFGRVGLITDLGVFPEEEEGWGAAQLRFRCKPFNDVEHARGAAFTTRRGLTMHD
eukprot:3417062-Pyramimonas_sp.AAC.1